MNLNRDIKKTSRTACIISKRKNKAGRNSSGRITMFHRGGGSKRLFRVIDFKRNFLTEGTVEKIDYDPNRSARIALIKWSTDSHQAYLSYILACDKLEVGDRIVNHLKDTNRFSSSLAQSSDLTTGLPRYAGSTGDFVTPGNNAPLAFIPIGTFIHNVETRPGQGGQLVRSAGTCAQLIQKWDNLCIIRLPSGIMKQIDSRCRATFGIVSNSSHNTRKLTKAGQNRWLGRRPIVRGVAMNPIDHPHGGGEGRTKGGRPSVSPWGKLTKGGFKTVIRKKI